MKKISVMTALVAMMFASGCAHMINVTPPANTISPEGITKVVPLAAINDKAELESKQIAYVFAPVITTTSKSSSALTWPPTNFTVTIACTAANGSGANVWNKTITGTGDAVFEDFKHDFSLAARR